MQFVRAIFTPQEPIESAPPVGTFGNLLRWVFAALGAFALLVALASDPTELGTSVGYPKWFTGTAEIVGLIAGCILLAKRRQLPLAVMLFAPVVCWLSVSGSPAATIATLSLYTRQKWRETVPSALLLITFTMLPSPSVGDTDPGHRVLYWIVTVISTGALVALGVAIGAHREKQMTRRAWLRSEELMQHARVEEIRALERAAIAREMHDVLAHRISMVALHSGALAYRTDMPAEQIQETAQLINDNARRALSELREVLGALRGSAEEIADEVEAPQPTLARLPQLWEEVNAIVAPVQIIWHGLRPEDVEELQDSVSRNAYRVIQESLTNARKHAPGMPVEVTISRPDQSHFRIVVSNRVPARSLPQPGATPVDHLSGFGLIGMAERVRSSGGSINAGVFGEYFVVDAFLPWTVKETA